MSKPIVLPPLQALPGDQRASLHGAIMIEISDNAYQAYRGTDRVEIRVLNAIVNADGFIDKGFNPVTRRYFFRIMPYSPAADLLKRFLGAEHDAPEQRRIDWGRGC